MNVCVQTCAIESVFSVIVAVVGVGKGFRCDCVSSWITYVLSVGQHPPQCLLQPTAIERRAMCLYAIQRQWEC